MGGNGDGIIALNHHAEVTGCGQMMVHAAVGDQKKHIFAYLAVENAGNINPGFADQPPAEFDHEAGIAQTVMTLGHGPCKPLTNPFNNERPIIGRVGNPETPAQIDIFWFFSNNLR